VRASSIFLRSLVVASVAGAACIGALAATSPDAPVILIQNATVLTVTHGTIEHGSVLLRTAKSRKSAQT